jgi:bifunctional UDP-N-acetylglucosamine pyrophosphorylase / glucosamine-1-phosphate N-acetyltransferase
MRDLHVLVLAAGKGTRMKSALPKVLHPVAGRPLLDWVLHAAAPLQPSSITVIVGYQGDTLRRAYQRPGISFVVQEPQLGTAHAVMQAEPVLGTRTGTVLLLSGDVPLITSATLARLLERHREAAAAETVLTAIAERPSGYGRIIRSDGHIARVVEERDASADERRVQEINTGVYAFDLATLFPALRSIATGNAQGEYYLTDLVSVFRARGLPVATVTLNDLREVQGINSRNELAEVGTIVRQNTNDALMAAGVTLVDPATTYVDADVTIGADTVLHPNVYLEGTTRIGTGCEIHSGVRIVDSTVGDSVVINNHCVITGATVASNVRLGPFAHVRPGSDIRAGAHVGNFVELKKTVLGEGSKANHLAYLGDATIGEGVNVGAGTITCNYDGVNKNQTIIEDGAFIGSDSQLVAPVRIGKGAYVAAGSSIVEDVPPGALGVARGRQTNVEGWVARNKAKRDAKAKPK